MKSYNNILSLVLVVALSVFTFSSCDSTEGTLYQGEDNKVSFLAPATNLYMIDGTLNVPIGRTSTNGSLSVPVRVVPESNTVGYENVFKTSGTVDFANGEGQSYVAVNYNDITVIDPATLTIIPDGYDIGVSLGFPFSLSIDNDDASPSKVTTTKITALNELDFKDAGTGSVDSEEGWYGKTYNIDYQKAIGVNAYKIIQPFSDYNIAFLIGSDGVSVTFPDQVIYPHPSYGPVTMEVAKAVYDEEANAVIVSVASYTVSAGSFGPGVEIFYLP